MGKEVKEKKKDKGAILEFIEKHFIYFVLYAIFGWLYEVFLEVVVYKWGFSNRGVLFGPYCPVYGFGALAFIFTVYPIIKNKKGWKKWLWVPVVFLLCMLIATTIELVTSYICEWTMGSWPWQTYADYKINFQARIIQPLYEKITDKLGRKKINIVAICMAIVLIIDMIYTFFIK